MTMKGWEGKILLKTGNDMIRNLFLVRSANGQQQRPGLRSAAVDESRSAWERRREDPRSDQPQGHDAQQAGTIKHQTRTNRLR